MIKRSKFISNQRFISTYILFRWRQDKQFLEANPDLQTKEKQEILQKVKLSIENRIDQLNEKISDFKQKEKQLKRQELDQTNDDNIFERDESVGDLLHDVTTNK